MSASLLQRYAKLVDFLGRALGPDYEIALHDTSNKNCSIVAISNNHISGRAVGAPLTNLGLKVLMEKSYTTQDYILHYQGISNNGKHLRSCTYFIKEGGRLLGMLCINFDDSRYQALIGGLMRLCHPDSFADGQYGAEGALAAVQTESAPEPEHFHPAASVVAGEAVKRQLAQMGVEADRLTGAERQQIIASLRDSGVFLLKGAVNDVAEALHCSPPSVYRYISRLTKES